MVNRSETNLFDGMGEAWLICGEWHLMNECNVRAVQLKHHVQQYISAGYNHTVLHKFTFTSR